VGGLGPTELDEQKKVVNIFFFTSAFLSSSYLHGYLFLGFALKVKEIFCFWWEAPSYHFEIASCDWLLSILACMPSRLYSAVTNGQLTLQF
jgi:hypothetical protein